MMVLPEPVEIEKYRNSTLDEQTAETIRVQLQKLMESEKLYLQRDLRSKDLADRLATSVHRLSQVLNERVGMSFPDFINNLRIEEAKKILAAGDDNKMETIALDMGFNNKVSFNKAFRKFTGVTPSQFKQQEQGNSSAA
jgi:YesN/AraC family two-component response regulator